MNLCIKSSWQLQPLKPFLFLELQAQLGLMQRKKKNGNKKHLATPECSSGPTFLGWRLRAALICSILLELSLTEVPMVFGVLLRHISSTARGCIHRRQEKWSVNLASLATERFLYAKVISRWSINTLTLPWVLEAGKKQISSKKKKKPLVYSIYFYKKHTKTDIKFLAVRRAFLLNTFHKLKHKWQPALCKDHLIPCITLNTLWAVPGAAYCCCDYWH